MSTTLSQIDLFAAALALPQPVRAELAERLLASLEKPPGVWSIDDPGLGAELDRRWAAYKSGEMPASDWQEVVSRVRTTLAEGRAE